MQVIPLEFIQQSLVRTELIDRMRDALIAQARGECDTPMPMHLSVPAEEAEIHIKSSYQQGGRFFAVKVASGFPHNLERGLSVGSGIVVLLSGETGVPAAVLADEGLLTDMRTAAVAAVVSRELGRTDRVLGVLGSGIQARLQAQMHAEVLDLERIVVWGRNSARVRTYADDIAELLPDVEVVVAASPGEVAARARLLVTVTASRAPLLRLEDIGPGTHIAAVGSDSPGKQELAAEILERAALLLVDSRSQCMRLGELQHASHLGSKAIEAGEFLAASRPAPADAVTVCDFTGLGVEDLYAAEYIYEKLRREAEYREEE